MKKIRVAEPSKTNPHICNIINILKYTWNIRTLKNSSTADMLQSIAVRKLNTVLPIQIRSYELRK